MYGADNSCKLYLPNTKQTKKTNYTHLVTQASYMNIDACVTPEKNIATTSKRISIKILKRR